MTRVAGGPVPAVAGCLMLALTALAGCDRSGPDEAINELIPEDQYPQWAIDRMAAYEPDKVVGLHVGRWRPDARETVLEADSFQVELAPGRRAIFLKREVSNDFGPPGFYHVWGTFRWVGEPPPEEPDRRRVSMNVRPDGLYMFQLLPDRADLIPTYFVDHTDSDRVFVIVQNNLDHPTVRRWEALLDSINAEQR